MEQADSKTKKQSSPKKNGNAPSKTKLQLANDTLKDIDGVVDSAKSIHEKLGNPANKFVNFIKGKLTKSKKTLPIQESNLLSESIDVEQKTESIQESQENIVESFQDLTNQEIVTTDDPFKQLEEVLLSDESSANYSQSVQKAINAQVKILTVIKSPSLLPKTYNVILSSLAEAILCASDNERENIQKNAGLMLQSLIFFQDAQLLYEEEEHDKEAEEMLVFATNALQESVSTILLASIPGPGSAGAAVKVATATKKIKVVETLCSLIKGELFSKYLKFWFRKKKLQQQRTDFYLSVAAIFDKLARHSDIFGHKQMLLSETILDYKEKLIPYIGDKTNDIEALMSKIPDIKNKMPTCSPKPSDGRKLSIFVIILSIAAFITADFFILSIYFDNSPIISISVSIVVPLILLTVGWSISSSIVESASNKISKWQKEKSKNRKDVARYYYDNLAKLLYS